MHFLGDFKARRLMLDNCTIKSHCALNIAYRLGENNKYEDHILNQLNQK